jgi:hypothetical protein
VSPRAPLLAYAAAFVGMLAGAAIFAVAAFGTMTSTTMLWVSSALSLAAAVAAVGAVVLSGATKRR